MSASLFRMETVNAKRDRLLGDILLVRPLSFTLLTSVAVAIALLLIGFIIWGEYTRKSHVTGYLAPDKGLIKVYSPQTGLVTHTFVEEGAQVKQGDKLFVISMERSSGNGLDGRAGVMEKIRQRSESLSKALHQQSAIDDITLSSLQSQKNGLLAEIEILAGEIETQKLRVSNAESLVSRYQALHKKRFSNALEVERYQEELLDRQLSLQSLQRQYQNLTRQVEELDLALAAEKLKGSNERSAMERNISLLAQQLDEYQLQTELVVHAPTDGVVTGILMQPGQTASIQRPLLSILPEGTELQAKLLVPSKAIGFLEENQSVSLRYHAFPYQRFGIYQGNVKEISKTMLLPGEANLPLALQEPVYRVTVVLQTQSVTAYGRIISLQAGMLLDADIKLDRRPLYQWILDPLYSLSGRV